MKFEEYQQKLGNQVVFHGYVSGEDKKQIFLNADVLLLPSYGEGLPVAILEGLSAGCAILTSDVGAIPEIVSQESGILAHPGNKSELNAALSHFCFIDDTLLQKQQLYNYEL